MEKRIICYGYEIINGVININSYEAKIVKRIFQNYASKISFGKIADSLTKEKISFYKENCIWNKNKIQRIIDNQNYIGNNEYPPILTLEEYKNAQDIKSDKTFIKKSFPKEIEYLKKITYCGICGNRMLRKSSWSRVERWVCSNSCKCHKYFTDTAILSAILQIIRQTNENPLLLEPIEEAHSFQKNLEIIRYQNEIQRMMEESVPNYPVIKQLILKSASKKFAICTEDKAKYTDYLLQQTKIANQKSDVTEEYLKNAIEKICIDVNGMIHIKMINGKTLVAKEEMEVDYGNTIGENSYQDRSKSAIK